ncbi:Homoserine dehydrogenase [Hanseniaspora guilliermondii]
MTIKTVNIAIVGTGVVGSSFLNQLINLKSAYVKYNLVAILNTKTHLISEDYSSLPVKTDTWADYLKANATQAPLSPSELVDYLKKSSNPSILVDNTSNETWAYSYPDFVNNGISIATPNKKAFSSDLKLWNQLFSGNPENGLVYHEATVGAGLPVVNFIKEQIQTGDEIEKIEGIFSGSLSFIFNTFSSTNKNFSEIVAETKSLGYTEPDPRDDLSGMDVARKVTILARIAGLEIKSASPDSFPINSFIPGDLAKVPTSEEFMQKLPEHDQEIKDLKDNAAKKDLVLRFVGSVDVKNNKVSVGIQEYSTAHPFASLKGSDNVISIKTKRYQNPVIIQGAGAGADVTAAGVLSDVIKIAERV